MAPIKTCVIGVGLSGLTFHVPFILALPDLFALHAVLERSPKSSGGRVKERFGVDVKVVNTLNDVLNDEQIELVIVGTPNATHYDLIRGALLAGKHGKLCGNTFLRLFVATRGGRQLIPLAS